MASKGIEVSQAEIDALIVRVEKAIESGGDVAPQDLHLLLKVLKTYLHLHERLQNNDLTLHKLRKLLGMISSSEKSRAIKKENEVDTASNENNESNESSIPEKTGNGTPHGKRGADEFEEAKLEFHRHENLKSGDQCPGCHQGKLYKFDPSQFVRITGHAPLQATVHIIEQFRCNMCQKVFKADLPEEVLEDGPPSQRFGWSAIALIVLLKYMAGTPFFRQHVLQKMLKVPIMPSTLWDQCESCANAAKPLVDYLKKMAADGKVFYSDDTGNKILNQDPVIKKRRGSDKDQIRTGIHTSGIISVLEDGREIILYKTGINHAGEFIDEILTHRSDSSGAYIHMSDALSSNTATVKNGIKAFCNVHARRFFVDIHDHWPIECDFVIDTYKEVYRFEDEAKERGLTDEERLELHKEKSLPLMEKMFTWAKEKLDNKEVEPNSNLGEALTYLTKHKKGLLAFTEHAGAPMDNNKQEQKLKLVILHRKNSLFFKEPIGALVADILMSLCATAALAGINVHEYLIEIQRRASEVRANPQDFLPWNFKSCNSHFQNTSVDQV